MKRLLNVMSLYFLYSCASLQTSSTHFVPSITQKGQFEGETSVGSQAASVNCAYSPLNHLTVMGNVQALLVKKNSSASQRNCEIAVGTYGSRSRIVYGINMGYGMGTYNWDYVPATDSSVSPLRANGNFQKVMVQAFLAFTDDSTDPTWFTGISLKENYFWDQYVSINDETHQVMDNRGLQRNTSFEPCIFTRNFFTRKFYLNAQAGMNISYSNNAFLPARYMFTRIGIGMKL
jgi:hypothetical protein